MISLHIVTFNIIELASPMPWASGYDAWLQSMGSQVRISVGSAQAGWPGRYITVRRYAGLSIYRSKERPLGTIYKVKVKSYQSPVSIFYVMTREIHNLDPQPHRHCMLAPRASAPRVTLCSLGKYWSRDFFSERG